MRTIEKIADRINDATVVSENASLMIKVVGLFTAGFVIVWMGGF